MNTIISNEEINKFVAESNAIEEIFKSADHALVTDHVKAVKFALKAVRQKEIPDPKSIHKILLRSQPKKNPGEYRTCKVFIGRDTTPSPDRVLSLMADLVKLVLKGPKSGTDIEQWVWDTHCEFGCIHPFIDGNGRVGRIWMNAIRLIHELPWLVIFASKRHAYYHRIRIYKWEHYRENAAENPYKNIIEYIKTWEPKDL